MHKCSKCLEVKPDSEFYRAKKRVNGTVREYRQSPCKECLRELRRKERTCPICSTTWTRVGGSVRGSLLCDDCRPAYKKCGLCEKYKVREGNFKGRRTTCEDCYPEYCRMQKYGLKKGEYQQMLTEQGGVCAICKSDFPNFYVDHCHASGTVRGLLCAHCNTGLGYFRDSTEALKRAISYLSRTESRLLSKE